MAKLSVVDLTGAPVGELDVADDVFAADVKEHLLWEVVRMQRAAKRAGTANTKGRAEIARTKDKLYKQKGTGNARHGSRRANVFRGGGVVHGPKPHKYVLSVNKKARAGALRSALSLRAKAGDLVVVKELTGPEVKTKALAQALSKLQAEKALLVDGGDNRWLQLSSRNLADANFLDVRGLNVYDILRHPKLVMSEASLRAVEARLTKATAGAEISESSEGGAA
ncbi:50S ribosomal protein L4 [Paraliomyxa miuraensis]|uniref:50S ribosomal protein L4 n=1 Tax=Paraliomyxa miuraensis TaxID=376150 RepID=UPI00224E4DE4|nr:50S ribosomal protein L4 [Paraliomyxa miuraensis]MCX4241278.1 50S ribosomal protein L4 [Paraliomyxa miuraensis]